MANGSVPNPEHVKLINQTIDAVSVQKKCDLLLFTGDIDMGAGPRCISLVRARQRAENVFFVLTTLGGHPDPAYRIMRCLQDAYKRITVCVPHFCKSAGTLMSLGAHEIVMADDAHLGPLDIQVARHNEVGERDSGLTPIQALNTLRLEMFEAFEHHFLKCRLENDFQLTSRTCADIAERLTVGTFAGIYAQFDPMRLGDVQRSMMIAHAYGERLSIPDNVKPSTVDKLVAEYPSHSFVIDRKEAESLFKNVRAPTEPEKTLLKLANTFILGSLTAEKARIQYLDRHPEPPEDEGKHHEEASTTVDGAGHQQGTGKQDNGQVTRDCEPKPSGQTTVPSSFTERVGSDSEA